MMTTAEGTTIMVAVTAMGEKGKQRRTMTMVVATAVGEKGEQKIKVIS